MTLRDLTIEQIKSLTKIGHETYEKRHQSWKNATPSQMAVYQTAFSDGLKAALEHLIPQTGCPAPETPPGGQATGPVPQGGV